MTHCERPSWTHDIVAMFFLDHVNEVANCPIRDHIDVVLAEILGNN